jgi:alanine-synthesizing transaminase
MFSKRLPAGFEPNRLAALLAGRRRAGAPLLDLTVTNPTAVGLAWPEPRLLAALGDPRGLGYDPDPRGLRGARETVAAYYADRGALVDPDRIVLTAGTSEAYAHLFRMLADPGDEILVPAPSYPLFDPLGALESVRLVPYPLRYDGRWWLDLEEMERRVSPACRGIIVVNPNNPTGSFLSRGESQAVERLAAERGIPLIADEVFGDFTAGEPDRKPTFAARGEALTFTLSGLSKLAGLPQLKLAWIVTAGPAELEREAQERLEWISDAFLSVGAPVQLALPALLESRGRFRRLLNERLAANEACLADRCGPGRPVEALPRQGGWSAVLRVPRVRSEEAWCAELLHRDVVVHPGHFYDFAEEAWLVVSLLPEPDTFREGIDRLVDLAG